MQPCRSTDWHAAGRPSVPAVMRLHLTYLWRHRRMLKLAAPTLLTELVQVRKVYDRDLRLPRLADKVRVKAFVEGRLGADWIIPTLWQGTALPDAPSWPLPFVVKSRHGCGQHEFIRTGDESWSRVRRKASRWMRQTYGVWLDEWLYDEIEPGLLVEPFIGPDGDLPIDYKLFVFHGRAEFIQVHIDREFAHRWIVMDRLWQRVSPSTPDLDPRPPRSLTAMIEAAEELGQGFDFVRIDFYEVDGAPRFGEMTFYPGSGLEPVRPLALDRAMGSLWKAGPLIAAAQITAGETDPHGLSPT